MRRRCVHAAVEQHEFRWLVSDEEHERSLQHHTLVVARSVEQYTRGGCRLCALLRNAHLHLVQHVRGVDTRIHEVRVVAQRVQPERLKILRVHEPQELLVRGPLPLGPRPVDDVTSRFARGC